MLNRSGYSLSYISGYMPIDLWLGLNLQRKMKFGNNKKRKNIISKAEKRKRKKTKKRNR